MSFLEKYDIEDLFWSHHQCEKELKQWEATKPHVDLKRMQKLKDKINILWAEMERRVDVIPAAILIEAIDGKIKLELL